MISLWLHLEQVLGGGVILEGKILTGHNGAARRNRSYACLKMVKNLTVTAAVADALNSIASATGVVRLCKQIILQRIVNQLR